MAPAFVTGSAPALLSGLSRASGTSVSNVNVNTNVSLSPAVRGTTTFSRSVVSMMTGRKFLVGGNWKCNLDSSSVSALVEALNGGKTLDDSQVEVVVSPATPYLSLTKSALRSDFMIAGQNAWVSKGGAYTGEVDATMLKDVGASWLIVGHSERRHLPEIKESDTTCATKARYALDSGLKVIFCIGELLEEREAGDTLAVCTRQLAALSAVITSQEWDDIVVAYEPVWAIGTGKVATPAQADQVHRGVRKWLADNVSKDVADKTRILYGGSVNAKNCGELAKLPDIDGFLVGGASLKADFLDIVDSYKSSATVAV